MCIRDSLNLVWSNLCKLYVELSLLLSCCSVSSCCCNYNTCCCRNKMCIRDSDSCLSIEALTCSTITKLYLSIL